MVLIIIEGTRTIFSPTRARQRACLLTLKTGKGHIRLENDIDVVKCVVAFCYNGAYDKKRRSPGTSELMHHAMVYTAADQYDIAGLKKVALDNFIESAGMETSPWKAVSPSVKKTTDLEIIGIIRYVFEQTHQKNDALRLAVLRTMQKYQFRIADQDQLFELVHEVPDLGAAYMSFMMNGLDRTKEAASTMKTFDLWKCSLCGQSYRLTADYAARHCPRCGIAGALFPSNIEL